MFFSYRKGDICKINTEAIVNSTSETLNDKNPVSENIIAKAGVDLRREIRNSLRSMLTFEINSFISKTVFVQMAILIDRFREKKMYSKVIRCDSTGLIL